MAYSSDPQTFVKVAPSTLLVVIKGPRLFLKVRFQTYVVFSYM